MSSMRKIECYELQETQDYTKNVRRFVKKKRFISLPDQLQELESMLLSGIFPGDMISRRELPVPHEVYKLRLPNPDTKVGKSNGYRVYYIVVTEQRIIVLLAIYYKKEDETVSDTYVDGLIAGYFLDALPYENDENLR